MILYADTSALAKLYISEPGSAEVAAAAQAAMGVAVCRLAWVEMMATLARRAREQPAAAGALASARQSFMNDWNDLLIVEVTQSVLNLAGDYAEAFALRAYDSVQLAALQTLRQQSGEELRFACFDARLVKAAVVLGVAGV